jgi:hypothetical protein
MQLIHLLTFLNHKIGKIYIINIKRYDSLCYFIFHENYFRKLVSMQFYDEIHYFLLNFAVPAQIIDYLFLFCCY